MFCYFSERISVRGFQREDLLVNMLVLFWFSFNVLVRISAGSSKIYVPTCIFVKPVLICNQN